MSTVRCGCHHTSHWCKLWHFYGCFIFANTSTQKSHKSQRCCYSLFAFCTSLTSTALEAAFLCVSNQSGNYSQHLPTALRRGIYKPFSSTHCALGCISDVLGNADSWRGRHSSSARPVLVLQDVPSVPPLSKTTHGYMKKNNSRLRLALLELKSRRTLFWTRRVCLHKSKPGAHNPTLHHQGRPPCAPQTAAFTLTLAKPKEVVLTKHEVYWAKTFSQKKTEVLSENTAPKMSPTNLGSPYSVCTRSPDSQT